MLNHTSQYAKLTPQQEQAIGRYVVEWSNVEFLLGTLLSRLLHTPDFLARTFTDSMRAAQIQDAIRQAIDIHQKRYLYKFIDSELSKNIKSTIDKITQLRANRNKIAHFCWARMTDEVIFGTNYAGGTPSQKYEHRNVCEFSLAELNDLYKEAFETVETLNIFINKIPRIKEPFETL